MNKRMLAIGGAVAVVAVLAVVSYSSMRSGILKGDLGGDMMASSPSMMDAQQYCCSADVCTAVMNGNTAMCSGGTFTESTCGGSCGGGMMGSSPSMMGDQWEPTVISGGDTTIVDESTGDESDSSSEGMNMSSPSDDNLVPTPPSMQPVTCKQPKPNKVRILGGAGINKGLLVDGKMPDRTDDVRKAVADELSKLAGTKAADYQAKKAPYDKVTPFACPEPATCEVQVAGSYTTDPDPVKVSYKTGPNRYESDAKFDLFATATCVPKAMAPKSSDSSGN